MAAITNTDIISIGIPVLEFQPRTVWFPKRLLWTRGTDNWWRLADHRCWDQELHM